MINYNVVLVDKTTILSGAQKSQLSALAEAVNYQLQHQLLVDYDNRFGQFVFRPDGTVPPEFLVMALIDDDGQAGALGYHDENADVPDGVIEVKTIIEAGAGVLDFGTTASGGSPFSLSTVTSHENCEMFGDPFVNAWVQGNDGILHAYEFSDATQGDSYPTQIGTAQVMLSNYLKPAYWDNENTDPKATNCMGLAIPSLTVNRGGYEVYIDPSKGPTPQQHMDEEMHPVLKAMKMKSFFSRLNQRLGTEIPILNKAPVMQKTEEDQNQGNKEETK